MKYAIQQLLLKIQTLANIISNIIKVIFLVGKLA